LARWQAQWVAARLEERGIAVDLVPVSTSGDQQQTTIGAVDGQGLFTREIQRELLAGRIDLAVHSLKDLPTDAMPGLCLAAVPRRAAVADVLISPRFASLDALPQHAVLGTGSLRRRAQILHVRPDLNMSDIRGNVDTRLRKLHQGGYDAIVLAAAGIERLGFSDQITEILPLEVILPAVGQGALGLESRSDDPAVQQAIGPLDDADAHRAVLAERALLAALHGGCLAPIAAWARGDADLLTLTARVLSGDGAERLEATLSGPASLPEQLGVQVADALIGQGAVRLIEACRK
jgi:hydroxymethylbilane synthase